MCNCGKVDHGRGEKRPPSLELDNFVCGMGQAEGVSVIAVLTLV